MRRFLTRPIEKTAVALSEIWGNDGDLLNSTPRHCGLFPSCCIFLRNSQVGSSGRGLILGRSLDVIDDQDI